MEQIILMEAKIAATFALLTAIIRIAQRDARSTNPSRRLDAELFLLDFLEGIEEVSD